jgi:hypothetical protein
VKFTKELKETCIKEYIKKNTVSLKCSTCKSTSNLLKDLNYWVLENKLNQDIFCSDCLAKSLSKDKIALEEVYCELYPESYE